jgi:cytidylate kinase
MVAVVDRATTRGSTTVRAFSVVELTGLAGVGKTTLSRAMDRYSASVTVAAKPNTALLRDGAFFARNGLRLVPTYLRLYQSGVEWLTWRDMARMAILKGWHLTLRPKTQSTASIVVLDHGPAFMLAQLYGFGPDCLRTQRALAWWDGMYRQWAAVLDRVVWLDAPDQVLLERIHSREKQHAVKGKSEREASGFLTRYRAAYETVLSRLVADGGGPRLLRIDTGQQSPEEAVGKMLREFGLPVDPAVSQSAGSCS